MANRLVTFTTDFGIGSPYIAKMKGMLLSQCPDARIVDISHVVGPQNVREGALILADTAPWFPATTLHVAVVDPGSGTSRRLIYAEIGSQRYLAPDNGLISLLTRSERPTRVFEVENARYFPGIVSILFESGEIFSTVAGHLLQGVSPEQLGPAVRQFIELHWPQPQLLEDRLLGEVLYVDPFGNLTTNITAEHLSGRSIGDEDRIIECAGRQITGVEQGYGANQAGELIAVIDSQHRLEIAVVNGNAAKQLDASVGTPIIVY